MNYQCTTNNKKETLMLANKLAKFLNKHDIITLTGDLGAGKTTFVRGVIKAIGIKEKVISPTFNILKCYFEGKYPIYHIDAYRLEGTHQDIGLEEYIEGDGIAFVEWPLYIKELLRAPHLEITIKNLGKNKRLFTFSSNHPNYIKKIEALK